MACQRGQVSLDLYAAVLCASSAPMCASSAPMCAGTAPNVVLLGQNVMRHDVATISTVCKEPQCTAIRNAQLVAMRSHSQCTAIAQSQTIIQGLNLAKESEQS